MQRSLLLILAFLPFMPPASVQASDPVVAKTGVPLTAENADVVVARLMSFDRNGDGTIAAPELPERMQALVARGDADGNGVIDEGEARALTRMPFPRSTFRPALLSSGTYGFVDDITLSSRSHVEGAIEDLRLPAGARQDVLAVASRFMDAHESAARAALLDELTDVLPAAHLALFETAVDMALHPQLVPARTFNDAARALRAEAGSIRVLSAVATVDGPSVRLARTDLGRFISAQSLAPEQRAAVESAVERFKKRLHLDGPHRDALLGQMEGLLDPESRDNLRASLDRRPVAATGRALFFAGAGHGVPVSGQFVVVPLVHRMER
jgi:hypothetical protein